MSDYQQKPTGSKEWPHPHRENEGCPSDGGEPADQPKEPCGECESPPETKPPVLKDPERCPPDPCCNCPDPPHHHKNCLEKLIDAQASEVSQAQKATDIQKELQTLLDNATKASKPYTKDKYHQLVKAWKAVDDDIADVIRRLVCAVPCWRCLIECYICPLLEEIRYLEQRLNGKWALYGDVHSLYDLQYWLHRDRDRKQAIFDRILAVLTAWNDPAGTIETAINTNAGLVKKAQTILNPDAPKLVYDVFLTLVPLHLAIAPPAASGVVTKIAKEYTEFCSCDKGDPDDCCGPDVGVLSLRQRLIGPQPYLVHPDKLLPIICCIAENRYLPASDALKRAIAASDKVDQEVKDAIAGIAAKLTSLPSDANAALPVPVDCDQYVPAETRPRS
jgi:hypothetical protein